MNSTTEPQNEIKSLCENETESHNHNSNRRDFLQASALAGAGLVVGFYLPGGIKDVHAASANLGTAAAPQPNAFIQIAPNNSITMVINKLEMGQGVNTSLAQLIAEELDCDFKNVSAISAPVDPVYNHTAMPTQMTGGSSALISSWDQHRKIGASMREMLKTAAAQKWHVPVAEVSTENGFVLHPKHERLSYGALASAANKLPFPQDPPLKKTTDFKIIGQSVKRVDAADKVNGKAVFGIDVRLPGMLYAVVARPPLPSVTLESFDDKEARALPGVLDIVRFGEKVAVLAKNTFTARKGRDLLKLTWKMDHVKTISDESLMAEFKSQAKTPGHLADHRGDTEKAMKSAKHFLKADYEFPYLSHASMEPLNCTINYDGSTVDIYAGHQMPTMDREAAAKILGLAPEKVMIHTTYAGGSFGRRGNKNSDYVVEASQLAKAVKKPLKITWTREDDMRGGYYRPMNFHRVKIGLDAHHKFLAWDHNVVGQSIVENSFFEGMMVRNGVEATVSEGVSETPYELANFRCLQTRPKTAVSTSWWRSVGHSHTAYAMETMMDELAEAMKKDALELRMEFLKKSPRHLAVLKLLQEKTGWGRKEAPKGRAWGLAIHQSFNSVVGHVVEVSVQDGNVKVHKVWSAVHCGQVVNPQVAASQVESSVVFGLSAALYGQIKIAGGQIVTGNFNDYPVLRTNEMPVVEVSFVDSHDHPTGLGEPGLPPVAPAVANAIYKLTKKRLRKLPFSESFKA